MLGNLNTCLGTWIHIREFGYLLGNLSTCMGTWSDVWELGLMPLVVEARQVVTRGVWDSRALCISKHSVRLLRDMKEIW